jgi:hypothetical protein
MKLDIEEYTKEEPIECRRCGLDATFKMVISTTEIDKTCCACGYTESWLLRRRGRGCLRYDNHYAPAGIMVHVKTKDKSMVITRLESMDAIREAEERIRKEVRDGRVDGATACIRMWDSEKNKVTTVLCPHTLELDEVRGGLRILATAAAAGLSSEDKPRQVTPKKRSASH